MGFASQPHGFWQLLWSRWARRKGMRAAVLLRSQTEECWLRPTAKREDCHSGSSPLTRSRGSGLYKHGYGDRKNFYRCGTLSRRSSRSWRLLCAPQRVGRSERRHVRNGAPPPMMRRSRSALPLLALGVSVCAFIMTQGAPAPPLMPRLAAKRGGTELVPPKRPPSSYMSWLNENRDTIVKKMGTNAVAEVAKEAGAQWRKLSAAKKKPYEQAATKALEKFHAEMDAFKAAGGVIEPKRRRSKKATLRRSPRGAGSWELVERVHRWSEFIVQKQA
eukprot:Skav200547  [mRNA]  locus=scaffold676:436650:441838:- [translate_table: standard]